MKLILLALQNSLICTSEGKGRKSVMTTESKCLRISRSDCEWELDANWKCSYCSTETYGFRARNLFTLISARFLPAETSASVTY